jgi:hypothetical protein
MKLCRPSARFLRGTRLALWTALLTVAGGTAAGESQATIVVPQPAGQAAPITPQAAPGSGGPSSSAAPSPGSSSVATDPAASAALSAPAPVQAASPAASDVDTGPSNQLLGPGFYQRTPGGPDLDQLSTRIAELNDILANPLIDLRSAFEAIGELIGAEKIVGELYGWQASVVDDDELRAAAAHRFAGTPDFYQRNNQFDPVQATFDAIPTPVPFADQLAARIAAQKEILADPSTDLATYAKAMTALIQAEALVNAMGDYPRLNLLHEDSHAHGQAN